MSGNKREEVLQIGWASRDVTPDRPVNLMGQFYMRISEGVEDPVTVTALAVAAAGSGDAAILVSCDCPVFRDDYDRPMILRRCREAVRSRNPGIKADRLILNATHTHTAPNTTVKQYEPVPPGVMPPEEYAEILIEGIAGAAVEAWENRGPGRVSWGLGTAVVGHNRRVSYFRKMGKLRPGIITDGTSRMYGNTNDPEFSHIEGYEDHYMDLLYTWNEKKELAGVVVNLACPAQETEGARKISADFWHEVRTEIRGRHGEHVQVLPQCSAAGDQSPRRLWYREAEERMLALRGLTMREEIGRRAADAVDDVLPAARKDIREKAVFEHAVKRINLPRRLITDREAGQVKKELAELEAGDETARGRYAALRRCRRTLERYELQKENPEIPMELHAVRLGEVAFATNRFELFLDFGIRIKARSPAVQTFLIQLAADDSGSGTYLPSERSAAGGGYGGGIYDNLVGPEGGQVIVEETLSLLNNLWP